MQEITLICVGRLKEPFYIGAAEEYVKRLCRECRIHVEEVTETRPPPRASRAQIAAALHTDAERIQTRLAGFSPGQTAVLCIEGVMCGSEDFARQFARRMENSGSRMAFIIGGSHGLAESVKNRAEWKLSLSPMTFPHHLARVMLLEQIYRAYQIRSGTAYHK